MVKSLINNYKSEPLRHVVDGTSSRIRALMYGIAVALQFQSQSVIKLPRQLCASAASAMDGALGRPIPSCRLYADIQG